MFHSRKSMLCNSGIPWVKKDGNNLDVTIGAYNGAKIYKLIQRLLLSLVGRKYNSKDIGLLKDDTYSKPADPYQKMLKKCIEKIVKAKMLDIVVEFNLKLVNYQDVTFNIGTGT